MLFSSVTFLFYFLPALILVYWLAPKRLRNLVMILGSLTFYAWGEIRFIPVLVALSIIDYNNARMMDKYRDNQKKRRMFMLISVGCNLSVLMFFKYTNFFISNLSGLTGIAIPAAHIMLPIGVSFNSFQEMSTRWTFTAGKPPAKKAITIT
jgi:alginate O-acetyltransferase complex protein AlgI